MNSEGIDVYGKSIIGEANAVRQKAVEAKPEMMRRAQKWAKKFGGSVVDNEHNIKSVKSILSKVNRDKKRPKEFGDVLRTTVIVEPDKFEEAVRNAEKEASRLSYGDSHRQGGYKFDGYTGFISNFRARNGVRYEIQINTPKMIYAKENYRSAYTQLGRERYLKIWRESKGTGAGYGHSVYEKVREMKDGREKKRLRRRSRDYYSIFK